MPTGDLAVYSRVNGINLQQASFHPCRRARARLMTLLPWKRKDRESRPQAPEFEELAMPLLPSLYNVARWLARDPTEAEDLVQETFLKALRGFPSFEAGTNFKAWIFRILRNTYLTSRTGLAARRTVSLEEQMEGRDDLAGVGY